MGLDVPATAVLSPSTSTDSSPRGDRKAAEPSWKAAVHSFLARLGSDVESYSAELRCASACHLWLGTPLAETQVKEGSDRHLFGSGRERGRESVLQREKVWVSETDSEDDFCSTLENEPLPGLKEQLHAAHQLLPLNAGSSDSLQQSLSPPPTVSEPVSPPHDVKKAQSNYTKPAQLTACSNTTVALPRETTDPLIEPPTLPRETTDPLIEPPTLPQGTKQTDELVVQLAESEAEQKKDESDVVMIPSSDEEAEENGERVGNGERESANGDDSTTMDTHSGSSKELDYDSLEASVIICQEEGMGVDGGVEEEGEKGEEGEGSDEGIGMEEVSVESETGEGGRVIVVIGSEDEKEQNQDRSGMEQNPMIHCCGMELTQSDLSTLAPSKWLNDQVVNSYMRLLLKLAVKKPGTVAIANTFFYTKLCRGGIKGVKRWMKNVDFGRLHLFLVPIHLPDQCHWCLAVVHLRRKVIEYYDSLGGRNPLCLKRLLKFVLTRTRRQHCSRKQALLGARQGHWRKCYPKGLPRQSGGSDCGIFVCQFARWVCSNQGRSRSKIPFTQSDIPRLRQDMKQELEIERLLQPHH